MMFTTWVPDLQSGPFATTVTDTRYLGVGYNKVPCVNPLCFYGLRRVVHRGC